MVIQKGLSPRTLSVDSEIDKEPFKTQRNLFSFFFCSLFLVKTLSFVFSFFPPHSSQNYLKVLQKGLNKINPDGC